MKISLEKAQKLKRIEELKIREMREDKFDPWYILIVHRLSNINNRVDKRVCANVIKEQVIRFLWFHGLSSHKLRRESTQLARKKAQCVSKRDLMNYFLNFAVTAFDIRCLFTLAHVRLSIVFSWDFEKCLIFLSVHNILAYMRS